MNKSAIRTGVIMVMVLLGACAGGGATSSNSPGPTDGSVAPSTVEPASAQAAGVPVPTNPAPQSLSPGQATAAIPGCEGCMVLSITSGFPSTNGPASIAVVRRNLPDEFQAGAASAHVITNAGNLVWSSPTFQFDGPDPVVVSDKSGNVLIQAAAGAHSGGVYVIRPGATGVETFDSFENAESMGAFYGDSPSHVADQDGDGLHEIYVTTSDYEPNYADGTNTTATYHWNGARYQAVHCEASQAGGPKKVHQPSAGRC